MDADQFSMGNAATMREAASPGPLGCVDDYELVRELGGGGFGTVCLARDPKSGVQYAVKGLPPLVRGNKEEVERILANFNLISQLEGHHIAQARFVLYPKSVRYNDSGFRDRFRVEVGDPLLFMSYAPGVTLSKWRMTFDGGCVPPVKAAEIVRQVAEALDYAHEKHVLHRDVKPSNVMIEEREDGGVECRVLDFGLAAEIRTSMGRVSLEIRDTSGTRPYMAPEQWAGERQGPATDQYALAALYCELVSGEVPFQSAFETGDVENMRSVVLTRKPDLSGIPRSARAAVRHALAKKPDRRFESCTAFAQALMRRPTRLVPVLVGAVGCAALAAVVLGVRFRNPPSPSREEPEPVPHPPLAPAEVPPHVHAYGAWETNVAPSCQTGGAMRRVCTSPGCTEPPVFEVAPLPKLGHRWGDWHELETAKAGVSCKERVCVRCSDKESLVVAAPHRHAYGGWVTNAVPSCMTKGLMTHVCTAAGCSTPPVSETVELAELGHDWGAWCVATPAKVGAAGEEIRTCTRCLGKESRSLQPLPPHVHVYGAWVTNAAPQCAAKGSMTRTCGANGCAVPPAAETVELEELGHEWAGWRVVTPAKVGVAGEERRTCPRCRAEESRPLPPPADVIRAADLARLDVAALAAGALRKVEIGENVVLEMIWCPPGEFMMGSPKDESGHGRLEELHRQTIEKGFWLGKFEVSQTQWQAIVSINPSRFTRNVDPARQPVDSVTLSACQKFVDRLNEQAGVRGFRLPTSAEWEYACRAGTTTPFAVETRGINCANSRARRPVGGGTFPPNPWGFHDMHGNVGEWTPDVARGYAVVRAIGLWSDGVAVRGGSWKQKLPECRSASVVRQDPDKRSPLYGFRLCYDPSL